MKNSLYEVLGVPRNATAGEVQKAYRRIALEHHPDRAGSPESLAIFREATQAYGILGNELKRRQYDKLFEPIKSLAELFSRTQDGKDVLEVMLPKAPAAAQRGTDILIVVTVKPELLSKGGPFPVNTGSEEFMLQVPPGEKGDTFRLCRVSAQGKPGKNNAEPGDLWVALIGG